MVDIGGFTFIKTKISNMAKVTFETLRRDAKLFDELKNNSPAWWQYCKNEKTFYIEVRKDNNINVYFEGGSIIKVHYCSRHKVLQTFTHYRYLGLKDKTRTYVNCAKTIDKEIDKITNGIKKYYSQKNGKGRVSWSEKYIQGQLIINNRDIYLDSEFAYKDEASDIRIDLVKCENGTVIFVELKRLDDNRMLKKTDDSPEIVFQMKSYADFIKKYRDQILAYYQKLYDIKKDLGLPVPEVRPQMVSTIPELLIFNRWTHLDKQGRRKNHLCRMEEILQREKVTYSIIDSF